MFLVDASGSLVDSMPLVIEELKKTIDQLDGQQRFGVIFFQGDKAIEVPPSGLKPAGFEARQRAKAWINPSAGRIVPGGRCNPGEALRMAAAYRPDLIWIFADTITGDAAKQMDRQSLFALMQELDPSATMQINATQFFYKDPENTLRELTQAHRGDYRFLSEQDLSPAGATGPPTELERLLDGG